MKGVVLAGGTGSRLGQITKVINKHLVPVGAKPMIYYPLEALQNVEIREVLVVTGTEHAGMVIQQLEDGRDLGLSLTYRVQAQAGGIAQALLLAEEFVGNDPFCVLLGDNLFERSLRPFASRFAEFAGSRAAWDARGMVLLAKVDDPSRFGVARLEGGKLVEILEKPSRPPSDLAVTGCYFYAGSEVFDMIRSLSPSGRGELEISDLNNEILRRGRLIWAEVDGWWTDAGTFSSLECAIRLIGSKRR